MAKISIDKTVLEEISKSQKTVQEAQAEYKRAKAQMEKAKVTMGKAKAKIADAMEDYNKLVADLPEELQGLLTAPDSTIEAPTTLIDAPSDELVESIVAHVTEAIESADDDFVTIAKADKEDLAEQFNTTPKTIYAILKDNFATDDSKGTKTKFWLVG